MSKVRYSESLHILLSSFSAAMIEVQALSESGANRALLSLSDVFQALRGLDDEAKEVLVTLMGLDLRPLLNPDSLTSPFLQVNATALASLPEIPIWDLLEYSEGPIRGDIALRQTLLMPFSLPLAHYSPLGSPDYILEFKPETDFAPGVVWLEVWSVAFRWFGIMESGPTKGKLIAQFALTPAVTPEKKSGRKPWRFNSLNPYSYEYVITEAIHASQIYKVCNSCDEVTGKLGFTSSGSDADTCDSCLGLIH